jgi:ABC-type sulfate transport system permease subunit
MINGFLTSLPAYGASIFADQLEDGNLLDALLLPLSANTALIPFNIELGVAPALIAAVGTLDNFAELFS